MKILTILAILLSFGMVGCIFGGEQEVILVPKNFKGYIVIIFNQKNGQPTKYENSKRVYEIPENGVLKTQFNVNDGWQKLPEFYYSKIAIENKLLSFVEIDRIPSDAVVGFMGASGNANKDYEGRNTVKYSLYYIGTKSDIEEAQKKVAKIDIAELGE